MSKSLAVTVIPFLLPIFLYPLIFISLTSPHPTPLTIAKIREVLSAFHCTLTTILCILCLSHYDVLHLLTPPPSISPPTTPPTAATLPIITLTSPLANAITAYETGYLLADTLIVIYARHIYILALKFTNLSQLEKRGLNTRHLLTHHVPLLISFLLLQLYILNSWERGILIIIMLMLQNFSSPFGTLRWFLSLSATITDADIRLSSSTSSKRSSVPPLLLLAADISYISAYAICRIWLLYWIIARFSAIQGLSTLAGFWALKWHCQIGIVGMGYVNVRWLVKIIKRAGVSFMRPQPRMIREKQKVSVDENDKRG